MRKHAMTMAKVINAHSYTKIAEVGVYKGRFMMGILWVCPMLTEYWGIDSWCDLHNPDYNEPNMAKMTDADWEEAYLSVVAGTRAYRVAQLIRADATKAAAIFPNGYFDLVFIDADHSYEAVLHDLKVWTPKVRRGGLMTGHDMIRKTPGVEKAVGEFYKGEFERLPATCWMKVI